MTLDANDIAREYGTDAVRAAFDGASLETPKSTSTPNGSGSWRDQVTTAAELQRQTFPDVAYILPSLIAEGLSILAGKPKIGKSWFALELAIAVAGGRTCLGDREPKTGDVLYAALEDNPRRLQRRIDKLLSPVSGDWPLRLTLATQWRRLDEGGVEDIAEWADEVAEPRLVILDTLAGVRPIRSTTGYSDDYETLTALHRLANERGIAILVLHHTRKMEADDPIDTISGTLGLAGCADTALVIGRSSQGTTLYVRGRDVEENEFAVQFDKPSCRWSIIGDAADVQRSETRRHILAALAASDKPMGPKDIAEATGIRENTVKQRLIGMVDDGEVFKQERGKYAHPDHVTCEGP